MTSQGWKIGGGAGAAAEAEQQQSGYAEDYEHHDTFEVPPVSDDEDDGDDGDFLFTEGDMMSWSGKQAVEWIIKARNAFEVFGLKVNLFDDTSELKKRFRRLSLLVHPDKNAHDEADGAFKKLTSAMRIMLDESQQKKLIERLGSDPETSGQGKADWHVKFMAPERQKEKSTNQLSELIKSALDEGVQLEGADKEFAANRRAKENLLGGGKMRKVVEEPEESWGAMPATKRRKGEKPAAQAWGLPAEFTPHGDPRILASDKKVMAAMKKKKEDGSDIDVGWLYRLSGEKGLANSGWVRVESTRKKGAFYFRHIATGKTVVDDGGSSTGKESGTATAAGLKTAVAGLMTSSGGSAVPSGGTLPPNWEKRESRSKPGNFYYANVKTGETRKDPPPPTVSHGASGSAWAMQMGVASAMGIASTAPGVRQNFFF